jgi:DNA-binding MarR family transcriptional regulator
MASPDEPIIKYLVAAIRKLVRTVYLDAYKMSRQYGLTGPQSMVLRLLLQHGSLSSADLSRHLYVTPSNITGIIDRLEKKALVDRLRLPGDRRVVMIGLTDAGRSLSRSLPDPIERKLISELAGLEPEHIQLLAVAMKQILNLVDTQEVDDRGLELNTLDG